MNRYALIDENSGFIWGVCFAADPIAACQIIDEKLGEMDRCYMDIGCGRFNGRSGYHVYIISADAVIDDGQDDDQIALVAGSPLAARIAVLWNDTTVTP